MVPKPPALESPEVVLQETESQASIHVLLGGKKKKKAFCWGEFLKVRQAIFMIMRKENTADKKYTTDRSKYIRECSWCLIAQLMADFEGH